MITLADDAGGTGVLAKAQGSALAGCTLSSQEDSAMPQVTVYKPNGETVLSTNAKRFEQTKGTLILHLEGKDAEVHGATWITTLPFLIQCGRQL
jgi:hypothetical protein